MKKILWMLLLMSALTVLLCTTALAADPTEAGIYELAVETGYESAVTITPKTADGGEIQASEVEINGTSVAGFYAAAVKLELTYSGAQSGCQYLVLALGDTTGVPTEGNVTYVDQSGAGDGGVTFNLYPDKLEVNKVYGIYLSSNAGSGITGLTRVATFKYYMPYKLGDVDEDGKVTATDALYALQMSVGRPNSPQGIPWRVNQRLAAGVDGTAGVTAQDALYILEASVGRRKL